MLSIQGRRFVLILLVLLLALPAAAQETDPGAINEMLTQGDQPVLVTGILSEIDFSSRDDWENYTSGTISLTVENGVFRVYIDRSSVIWAINEQVHSNVVIDVDTDQLQEWQDNGYGVACRIDSADGGFGYYFFISSDGFYAIRRIDAENGITNLIPWTRSDTIVVGGANRLTAVCMDDYLAIYVNGQFVDSARDDMHTEGFAGLAGVAYNEGVVEATFDNLVIWQAGEAEAITASAVSADEMNQMLLAGSEALHVTDVLSEVDFSAPDDWENYTSGTISLSVQNGVFRVLIDEASVIWAVNDQRHSNVVIDVETDQLQEWQDNGYGVACRIDSPDGGYGYYFFISSDGFYSIRKIEPETGITNLVPWTPTDTIEIGGANRLTAVCMDDYLAIYVNGQFVDSTRDDTYTEGLAGMAGVAYNGGVVEATFDNLFIWQAEAGKAPASGDGRGGRG